MRITFDRAANLATLLFCVATIALLARQSSESTAAAIYDSSSLRPGEVSSELKALLPSQADRSLVVALAPSCELCTESLPFYRELARELDEQGDQVPLIAALDSPESLALERDRLGEQDVGFDHLVAADFRQLRLLGTPTVLLVGPDGEVLDLWIGRLDERDQKEVLKAVRG